VDLRRGFKAEAKRLAIDVRRELGLSIHAPLDPYELAELYGVEVHTLAEPHLPREAVAYFTAAGLERFSAALMPLGAGCFIIENHMHDLLRRRSTMAHEMAHVLLEHEFQLLLATDNGCRASSSAVEAEAAELSGELLIPWEAAKRAALRGLSDQQVATCFNVSEPMARWRMNASGARKIATRAGKRFN